MDCGDAQRLDRDLEAGSRVGAGFVDLAVQRVCPGHETPSRLGQHHSARPRSNGGSVHCSNAWVRRLKARLGDAARRRGKSCRIWSGP